jgi:hypothetical protein
MTTNCRLPIIEFWTGENPVRSSLFIAIADLTFCLFVFRRHDISNFEASENSPHNRQFRGFRRFAPPKNKQEEVGGPFPMNREPLTGFGTGFLAESKRVKASPAQSSQIQPPPLPPRPSALDS